MSSGGATSGPDAQESIVRRRTIDQPKDPGNLRILVTAVISAQGIDVEGLLWVVNYELPHSAWDYVHRIGWTGRARMPGIAVSLVSLEKEALLWLVEKTIKPNRSGFLQARLLPPRA